jgi:glutamate:GABA antiporter
MISRSNNKISTLALVLLITGAIDSIRNLPATALFGSTLPFFFIFSAIVFFIPVALIAAELSSTWSEDEGGIYYWIELAFGKDIAFLGIWLQWVNTIVWFPTILSFIAGTAAYLIEPSLAQNKVYLVSMILVVFWLLTLLNLRGLKTSARFASICAVVGMIIPMILIIVLAFVWIIKGNPIQLHFTYDNIFPNLSKSQSWVSLTAIMTAFLGMELAAVHVKQIENPKKNYPKAMLYSVLLILSTMIFGSLAIAFVLPQGQIHLVDGVMQAYSNFFSTYHLEWFLPVIVIMLLIGSLGGMINWIISPAKGLLLAAQHGYLPKFLSTTNEHGVADKILILQAAVVSLLCGTFLLLPSVNDFYWFFTDLSTELYMLMYILMFLAAFRLKRKFSSRTRPFAVPGGQVGYYLTCLLGLFGCLITVAVGFIPPEESLHMSGGHHTLYFSIGILVMLFPAYLCHCFKIKKYGKAKS